MIFRLHGEVMEQVGYSKGSFWCFVHEKNSRPFKFSRLVKAQPLGGKKGLFYVIRLEGEQALSLNKKWDGISTPVLGELLKK